MNLKQITDLLEQVLDRSVAFPKTIFEEKKTQNLFLNLKLSIKNRLETQMARFRKSREFFFSTPGFIWLQDLQDTEVQRRF